MTPSSNNDNQQRRFKPRAQPTPVEQVTPTASTSIYKFKLNRSPGSGRWQYKTSPKPKVTIRKTSGEEDQPTTPNINPLLEDSQSNDVSLQARSDNDLELSGSQSGLGTLIDNDTEDNSIEKPPPVETLKVEISTPADFRDVYYEIATIKSPYTFQVINHFLIFKYYYYYKSKKKTYNELQGKFMSSSELFSSKTKYTCRTVHLIKIKLPK